MLTCAAGGFLAVCVLELSELVKLLGMDWKVEAVAGRENRDIEDVAELDGTCCEDDPG